MSRKRMVTQVAENTRGKTECPTGECPPSERGSQKQLEDMNDPRLAQAGPRGFSILGIDASLSACGLVIVPTDWGCNWSRVRSETIGWHLPVGSTTAQRIDRLAFIATRAVEFAREHGVTIAAIESYPFGKVTAAHALGEASGAIKVALRAEGIEVLVAPISQARKLLLGHLPRSGAKLAVRDYLIAHGSTLRTVDECDAFAAANWGLARLAGKALDEAS